MSYLGYSGCWDISSVLVIADAGEARLWRLDKEADYGALNKLARMKIKTELIEQNWDDMLRVAGSLKFGTISALEIMVVEENYVKLTAKVKKNNWVLWAWWLMCWCYGTLITWMQP